MLFLALFGPPGAGKGTQAKKIIEKYHLEHLSTGELIRQEIAMGTEIGIEAADLINRGELLSDEIVMNMVEHIIHSSPKTDGFLFDGFPRTVKQAEMLDKFLMELGGYKLNGLLSIEAPREELMRRMIGRAKIEGRTDDTPETIENRFKEYDSKTYPVAHYYEEKGKCYTIDGTGSVDAVFNELVDIIDHTK